MTFAGWLRTFLDQRGLQTPDQRPLYAYHCGHDEYVHLRNMLQEVDAFQHLVSNAAAAAGFVLYCAEWYRREYRREHAWSWDPIFSTLGGGRLSQQELARVVPKGIENYWKRPLHLYAHSRRDLLGSVFGEGGLPSQLLREAGGRFQSLFDRLLRQYEEWHQLGFSTVQQVAQLLDKTNFPQVFQSLSSVELIAGMADRLVALVRNYALDQAPDPVSRISTLHPKWREEFPLPLDDATGSDLLVGLLKTATAEGGKRRKRAGGWKCTHFWAEREPDALTARVTLPNELELALAQAPSTTRFELALAEGTQIVAQLGTGYAELVDSGKRARLRLRQTESVLKRRQSAASLNLVAMIGGAIVGSNPIPNSAVALGESPVGFERANDRWQLCGQASFGISGDELLLVLPPKTELEASELQADVQITAAPSICSLPTIRICGSGELRVRAEDSYRICMGVAQQSGTGMELTGGTIEWPTQPALTFIGVPQARLLASESSLQQAALYVASRRVGSGLPQEALGAQYVSLRSPDGDTLLRRRVGILPSDFRIELRGGDVPTRGHIRIHTQTRCLFQIQTDGLRTQQARHEACVELTLDADGLPPASIRLAVTPNLAADRILIEIPFPPQDAWPSIERGNRCAKSSAWMIF